MSALVTTNQHDLRPQRTVMLFLKHRKAHVGSAGELLAPCCRCVGFLAGRDEGPLCDDDNRGRDF